MIYDLCVCGGKHTVHIPCTLLKIARHSVRAALQGQSLSRLKLHCFCTSVETKKKKEKKEGGGAIFFY